MLRWLLLVMLCVSSCTTRSVVPKPTRNIAQGGTAARNGREDIAREHVPMLGVQNIQRSMGLLAKSSLRQRNHVRVLFYGQSITQSAWSRKVAQELRTRFPWAELEIQNRALGGFHAELLAKSAESDLYSFYPDLVIFHVYGSHERYEDIVRRLHERTTAEILLQTDHVLTAEEVNEQTDPAQLTPRPEQWSAFMNNAFLPALAERYQATLCGLRTAWKQHLRERAESPSLWLRDGLHLNTRGDALMARYISQCLRVDNEQGPSPAEQWVRTLEVGRDVQLRDGNLRLDFEGNRVDVILQASGSAGTQVRIDGRRPSEWAELYSFARAHSSDIGSWPPLFDLSSERPLLPETFTLALTRVGQGDVYKFALAGSSTGADGAGRTDQRFVSRSRRVVIDPEDWNVRFAFELAEKPLPEHFTVILGIESHFTDAFSGMREEDSRFEHSMTLAQGLPNGAHTLELLGDAFRVAAIRVYRPPLGRE